MRIKKEIILEEGERFSPNSSFYFYDGQIYEPCYYDNKKTGTYKPITNIARIQKILKARETRADKQKSAKQLIEEIFNKQQNTKIDNKFEYMDLEE